jgi:DNA polymerase III subunit epsilon
MTNDNTERAAARYWLSLNPLYLDTETTGLGPDAEIVQIAIIDDTGRTLLDTLVKPTQPIPPEATRIHGITTAQTDCAPTWADLWPKVQEITQLRAVIIYNADFDARLMQQSAAAHQLTACPQHNATLYCAMQLYADFWGDWSERHGTNTWQPLARACYQQGVSLANVETHSAAGDCEATRRLIHKLAADSPEDVTQ